MRLRMTDLNAFMPKRLDVLAGNDKELIGEADLAALVCLKDESERK